ncbi:MAG: hypothetical protein AB7E72_22170 [Lysobacterales bacterium]
MMNLVNPWTAIPDRAPFVLAEDRPFVDAYNSLLDKDDKKAGYRINTDYTPEPRLGPIDAPVLILQANPSYAPGAEQGREAISRELRSVRDPLHPHLGAQQEATWWPQVLKQLIKATSAEQVARGICSVEFFPYRSLGFGHGHIRLPSQQYTFDLVRRALSMERIIIVTRRAHTWFGAIPELAQLGPGHKARVFHTRNPQRTFISPGNLPEGAFDQVVAAIRQVGA